MVSIDDVRALAVTLPRSYEVLVHDRVKFRVGSIVYLAFSRDEKTMGFAFPKEEREALVAAQPAKFLMPKPSDMRYRWLRVRLPAIGRKEMREIVLDAWRMVVPQRVALEYEVGIAGSIRPLPDVVAPNLSILFIGINPGLYSAAVGHHFARPGNRFWRVLHLAGLTPTVFTAAQDRSLIRLGIGLTNIVERPSAAAAELTLAELRAGATEVVRKIRTLRPQTAVFLGLTAYRKAFSSPRAPVGVQPDVIGRARVIVLPNPSGAQARYQPHDVAMLLREALS